MLSHCRSGHPDEACGILAGRGNVAEKVYPITNIDKSPVSYQMDPQEQFRAMKEMRNDRHSMVAIFHSHPVSPPYPSNKDINLAFYPEPVYIIVSLVDTKRPEVRAFEIVEGAVRDVRMLHDIDAESRY
jgi:proteasome lid subunit RPN8/RPN11